MHGAHFSLKRELSDTQKMLGKKDGLAFRTTISGSDIEGFLSDYLADTRDRIYSPDVTLFAFIGQVSRPDGSCQDTVARVRADRVANGLEPCSTNTSCYVRARHRLPTAGIANLAKK